MKWDSTSTRYKKWANKHMLWHRWFAWRPVCFGGNTYWMCWVERRLDNWYFEFGGYAFWEYKV